jgi:signal transduction histidine kinase
MYLLAGHGNFLMNIVESFAKQPRFWLRAEAVLFLAAVVALDMATPWQYSWFVFYAIPVFVVALNSPPRVGQTFAIVVGIVAWVANFDTIPHRGWPAFGWWGVNRLCELLFVSFCGASIQTFREETRRRMQALERAQELEGEIVRAGEQEQMRIGQDLHDGVCQTLAAIDCAAQCLKIDLESNGSPKARLASEIQKNLSTATVEARRLARGISPLSMDAGGLSMALRDLAISTGTLFHTTVEFASEPDILLADAAVATHLYRITQEALNNAMRHANATRVSVQLLNDARRLRISVADDGCGLALQSRQEGMGWRTMRYRASLIGATVEMETAVGRGTTVRCTLPLPSEARSVASAAA